MELLNPIKEQNYSIDTAPDLSDCIDSLLLSWECKSTVLSSLF